MITLCVMFAAKGSAIDKFKMLLACLFIDVMTLIPSIF